MTTTAIEDPAKRASFSRLLLAGSILATAMSILVAAGVYWKEAEEARAQRQCEMYVDAMKEANQSALGFYAGIYAREGGAVSMARTLAAMLNMQPASLQFCYYPSYDPNWRQRRGSD